MTCGDDLFGESLCGEDDVSLAAASVALTSGAPFFDGLTRDFPLDADGRHVDIHPIDSAVQMALLVEAKKIMAAPDTGQTYREIKTFGPKLKSDVDNRTRAALKHLTDAGSIKILRIEHEQPNRHSLFNAVWYLNLETQSEESAGAFAN